MTQKEIRRFGRLVRSLCWELRHAHPSRTIHAVRAAHESIIDELDRMGREAADYTTDSLFQQPTEEDQ